MSAFEVVRDRVLGEETWCARTPAGLRVRVLPRPAFRETAAAITFAYGSTDLAFADEAGAFTTPAGTAHYLEHKLFEDEDLHAFARFAARGAQVNAQTGFTRTTYWFAATSQPRENLADLLRLVATAHVTDENVEKERGIIAQEVRMYEDSPEHGTLFDLLGCLYPRHPVRHTIGGTVESIGEITAAVLQRCWRAFYRTGNAALAVAGPVDPAMVLEVASACGLPGGPEPARADAADFGAIGTARKERAMQVERAKVLIGLKDRQTADGNAARTRRQLASRVVLDRLFAPSSEVREALHRAGDVDDSLGAGYAGEKDFAYASIGCESDEPERAEAALRRVLGRAADAGEVALAEEHLERMRRRQFGAFVRTCESMRSLAFGRAAEAIEDAPPFHALAALQSLTLADVRARAADLLREENLAVAVTRRA